MFFEEKKLFGKSISQKSIYVKINFVKIKIIKIVGLKLSLLLLVHKYISIMEYKRNAREIVYTMVAILETIQKYVTD